MEAAGGGVGGEELSGVSDKGVVLDFDLVPAREDEEF
jgi:hypothetical protein